MTSPGGESVTDSAVFKPQVHPLKLKHLPEFLAAAAASSFLRLVSPPLSRTAGERLGRFVHDRWEKRRIVAQENLRRVFPSATEADITVGSRHVFEHIARTFVEFTRMQDLSDGLLSSMIELSPAAQESLIRMNRPCIYVSAHLGNWEYLGRWLAQTQGPLGLLVNAQTNPLVDRMIMRWRAHPQLHFVPYRAGWPTLSALLSAGRSVALLADQRLDRGGLRLPFFGESTTWSKLPALLARRHDVTIVPLFLVRQENGPFRLLVEAAIEPDQSCAVEADIIRMTSAYIAACERVIRQYPAQYFFTHRRWPAAPMVSPNHMQSSAVLGSGLSITTSRSK